MKLTVNVTANDIKHGKRISGRSCPVARACRRLNYFHNNYPNFAVGTWRIFLNRVMTRDDFIELPKEAVKFIEWFDAFDSDSKLEKKIKPFKFEIEVPDGKE